MSGCIEKSRSSAMEEMETSTRKRVVYPEITAFTNENASGIDFNIYLPGVDKDAIILKFNEEYMYVKGETNRKIFSGFFKLCCPVDTDNIKASYREGFLKVKSSFKLPEMIDIDVGVI